MKQVELGQIWRERDSRFVSRYILVTEKLDVERAVCVPCDVDGNRSVSGAHSGRVSKIKIKNLQARFEFAGNDPRHSDASRIIN